VGKKGIGQAARSMHARKNPGFLSLFVREEKNHAVMASIRECEAAASFLA
jgi:hypothetical protein